MNTIGKRVRQLREDLDIRQAELSAAVNRRGAKLTQSHLAQLERGEKSVSLQTLTALAVDLGTSTDYLLGLTDDATPYQELGNQVVLVENDPERRARLQRLFSAIERLPPQMQDDYHKMIAAVLAGVMVQLRDQQYRDLFDVRPYMPDPDTVSEQSNMID